MQDMQPCKLRKECLNGDLSMLKVGLGDPKCGQMNLTEPRWTKCA